MQEREDHSRVGCVTVKRAHDAPDKIRFNVRYGFVGKREAEGVEHGQVDASKQNYQQKKCCDRACVVEGIEARIIDQPVDGGFEAQGNALEEIEQASAWGIEARFPVHAGVALGERIS